MKKIILIIFIFNSLCGFTQTYNTNQLKTIAEIWGETYLFHPSVIRSDKSIEWEKQLVDFLPLIKKNLSHEEFLQTINSNLLSHLNDPLTCVQKKNQEILVNNQVSNFQSNTSYDYYKISEDMLISEFNLLKFDSIISDKNSGKPLVFDLRINSELDLNPHKKSHFESIASLLTESTINLGSVVSREHFGWDEFNDWWYYEQRWKINNTGSLSPFKINAPMIQYQYPEIDLNTIETINRPIYFIVNKSFISYYYSLLKALKIHRSNTYLVFQNTGNVYAPWYSNTIKYDYNNFEFILNPTFIINNNSVDLNFDYSSNKIEINDLDKIIKNTYSNGKSENTEFTFDITQKPYSTTNESTSNEERILGIIKIWTIVKHFYVHHDLASENWNNMLEPYLLKAQKCNSDKEYYELIQNMMSKLNDSHVSTYHPSIFDYSKLFVAPIQFEWIENKIIITDISSEIKENFDIKIGDEIISIDEKTVQQTIKDNRQLVSASNDQSFYNSVISPGNFVGAPDIPMRISIKRNKKEQKLIVPRTIHIFQFFDFNDNRPPYAILENNIAYLNLSALTDSYELEKKLYEMKNTMGLILDLRDGYPTDDYSHFIEMLTNKTIKGRIDETPIICANKSNSNTLQITQNKYKPDTSFIYNNPIAVLIDKSMISRPEDIAVELREIENVFFVGEQTQGTDGEMTKISLPGGGKTSFTGQVIKFANGDQFQGIGITPDYKVEKSIEGIKKKKDEILNQAIKIMTKKISEK